MTYTHEPQLLADFDLYLRGCRVSVSTRENYAGAVRQFASSVGPRPAESVTLREFVGFLRRLEQQGKSPATVAARRAALGAFVAFIIGRDFTRPDRRAA